MLHTPHRTTLGLFTFAFFQVLMPFAMLSSKVVEYVRVTENCLGTIVASYEDDDKMKEGNLSDMARKTLTMFAYVQDLPYLRIMGIPIDMEMMTKFFYILAVLFILPLVTGGGSR
tara:strand:+ start:412 stop:756 length:345 start_codon:yes stop_codon:yes gene_type:complete|eukprot:g255.t1